ncbi:hypothetical protein [Egicoccus sp. AB-alg2]|uniref:hypothetical protein n=1 Tax=Egicoccus sp. AB-alg2 TaxID=3242693 RepID=UPI00359D2009
MGATTAFAAADLRALGRDPMLRLLLLAPVAMIGALVVGVPLVEGWLAGAYDLDLRPYRPAVMAFIAAVALPLFAGTMAGLLLLEDRESGVLPAVAVSPAGLRTYLVVRGAWTAAIGGVVTVLALLLHGGVAVAGVLVTGVLAAGCSEVVALLVGSLAGDRLEGIAVTKALTLPLALPVLAVALPGTLVWPFGVLPTAFPVWTLLASADGRSLWPLLFVGCAQLVVLGWLATRRLLRRAV